MADEHSHLIPFPEALEVLLSRLGELRIVLGPAAAPGVDEVERGLSDGLAAHARGDVPAAVALIGRAIGRLAELASAGDPREGEAMRGLAARFAEACRRGALGEAHEAAKVMRVRSGSVLHPKKER
jgi:hypothetical protein